MIATLASFGFVYFVHAPSVGLVKIGFTGRPRRRIKELSSNHRCSLLMLGVLPARMTAERHMHCRFDRYHSPCFEWFFADKVVLDFARTLPPLPLSATYSGDEGPYFRRVTHHISVSLNDPEYADDEPISYSPDELAMSRGAPEVAKAS